MASIIAGFALAGTVSAAEPTTFPDIATNSWVKVCVSEGPEWCNMVYDPVGRRVLHWGTAVPRRGPKGVHQLDYESRSWQPAYPSTIGGKVDGDHLMLVWGMISADEPHPTLVWDQVCYDPIRKQVVYAGPGAMLAYDPATRKWRDMKASVELYGVKHPGGPPAQWGAMCYDPVNDEIMMFPHAGVYNWDDWEKTGVVGGHLGTFVYSFKDNLWRRLKPAVEPPPRCLSRMAYDQKNQCIVVFGGERQDRLLHDTWAYDCKTRTWKELKPAIVPRPRAQHALVYHPKSGRVLMAGGEGPEGIDRELWALDAASGQWQPLALADPPWQTQFNRNYLWAKNRASHPFDWACAYDEANDLIVVRFTHAGDTYVLRPDASKAGTAKSYQPTTAPDLAQIPPDDPKVLEQLKALPANTWVRANPPSEPASRDYGTISIDRATGWLYYIGGGHSTYTGDDVEVYQPGANRWVRSHRPRITNNMHPFRSNCGFPAGVNFGGGWWTSHIYRGYPVHDGTLYVAWPVSGPYAYGPEPIRAWAARHGFKPGMALCGFDDKRPLLLFAYDWKARQWKVRIPRDEQGEFWGPESASLWFMSDSMGAKLLTLSSNTKRFGAYDTATNQFVSKAIDGNAAPGGVPYDNRCLIPSRQAVLFLYGASTWTYSIKDNVWTNLNPKNSPPNLPCGRLEYVPDQDVAYAVLDPGTGKGPQWAYSFKHNTWKQMEARQVNASNGPFSQMVYSAKYGVFVWAGRGCTGLMRPDFSQVKWE